MTDVKSITAVLIDDEQSVLDGLKETIEWDRYQINLLGCATDGVSALRLLLEWQPDFAIVDINMPSMSGLDIIKEARDNGIKTDFIILSGYGEFTYAQKAIAHGAKAYLLKPVNAKEINNQIGRICFERSRSSFLPASQKYKRQLLDDYFNRLIDGKYNDISSVANFLQTLDLSIDTGSCFVMVLQYDNAIDNSEEMLHNLNHNFQGLRYIFWQIDEKKIGAIFSSCEETAFHLSSKVIDMCRSLDYPLPNIAFGEYVDSITNASYSYGRALTALSYKIFDNASLIFSYENICSTAPRLKLQDVDCLPLVQHIVKRQKEEIKSFCEDFFNSLLYVKMPPPNYVYSMCYALYTQIQKEFSSFLKENISDFANGEELYKCSSTDEIKTWLIDVFCKLSDFVDAIYGYSNPQADKRADISDVHDEIIESARNYITGNIAGGIRLDDIARSVHLSSSYFATYFKDKTGVNLRDYLLQTKMEYAAKALRSDKMSVVEIADCLGYSDYRSFSRAFKNIYGCTPSDFQSK